MCKMTILPRNSISFTIEIVKNVTNIKTRKKVHEIREKCAKMCSMAVINS